MAYVVVGVALLQSLGEGHAVGTCRASDGSSSACKRAVPQEDVLMQIHRGFASSGVREWCCGKCGGKGFCSPKSGSCYASKAKGYYSSCGEAAEPRNCCEACAGKAYCSPISSGCYASKAKDYYSSCGEAAEPRNCCETCAGKAYCSPTSGGCYWYKNKDYYKLCDASAVPPGGLPRANSSENAIKFMSYNLMGWNAFNLNRWRGDNVLAKIRAWGPAALGAQEVEKGGHGYDEVAAALTRATALEHAGGSQFFDPEVLERGETDWVDLVRGYWMSMTRFTHKKSGVKVLFFDSHWKHGYGMEQAEIVARAIHDRRQQYENPPTILVGDTNQFCRGYEGSAIRYLKGEIGSAPVTFQDVHAHDYGKSFSDGNNPDCRVDFMLASTGQWSIVRSFIDRDGMGAWGAASDHAPLMGELVPIV